MRDRKGERLEVVVFTQLRLRLQLGLQLLAGDELRTCRSKLEIGAHLDRSGRRNCSRSRSHKERLEAVPMPIVTRGTGRGRQIAAELATVGRCGVCGLW